jgi:hypothetical protein
MCDTQSMRRSISILVHPSERYPITGEGHVTSDLNRSRLKLNGPENQSLTSLPSNPISDVIFTDRCGTNRWPT